VQHHTSHWITQMAQQILRQQQLSLQNITHEILWIPKDKLRNNHMLVDQCKKSIYQEAFRKIKNNKDNILLMDKEIYISNPKNILKKGYSIVRQNQKISKVSTDLNLMNSFEIQFIDKTIKININE
jgi:exonuclease VII large subunit